MDFRRAPPFRMEPRKDAQDANLHRTGRHDLHAPQAGIIHSRHVRRPYHPARRDQAAEAFLRGNAKEVASAASLGSRVRTWNVSGRCIVVAVASLVPVDIIALIWFRHCASKMPQMWPRARVTFVTFAKASSPPAQMSFQTGLKAR